MMLSRTAAVRVLQSHRLWRFASTAAATNRTVVPNLKSLASTSVRLFNSTSGSGGDNGGSGGGSSDGGKKPPPKDPFEDAEDIFGVNFDDGEDMMGEAPPQFKRDETTGAWSSEEEHEVTDGQRDMLNLTPAQQDSLVQDRVQEHWEEQGDDWASKMGQNVREAQAGLNVVGRSAEAQGTKERSLDTKAAKPGPGQFTQRLTRKEFESFQTYMRKQHKKEISEEDFPVMERDAFKQDGPSIASVDDKKYSTQYMTSLGNRMMDSTMSDDPFDDLMPSDLNVQRLVNRKMAKPIPWELLHHNNVQLLRSFMTTTGQIKHRLHSRLGAKYQRKIKKLIKRARKLGLVPYQGQFSTENHGWIHAPDINEPREWEKELERRGLVVPKQPEKNHNEFFKDVPEAMHLGFGKYRPPPDTSDTDNADNENSSETK